MKEEEGKDKTPLAEEEKKELTETPEDTEAEEPVEETAEEVEEEEEGKEEKVAEEATAEVSAEAAEAKEEEAVEEKVEEAAVEEEKPEAVGEEAKSEKEEREKEEREKEEREKEEIVEERVYTIPLAKAWIGTPRKRSPRAMRIVRSFVWKHMKLGVRGEGEEEEEPKRLVIDNEVNERVWGRGGEKPPRKVRVRAAKDKEGNVTVYLAEGD